MKYQGLVVVALLALVAVSALAVFSLSGKGKQGAGQGTGSSSGLSPEFFQVDRVYFDDWVDFMGHVSPSDFAVVVEITSGGRGVRSWSVGLDYGDEMGFEDNVMETSFGGNPTSENHKLVLREDMAKWTLPSGTHPQRGRLYHVKVHLTLTDNTLVEWEGDAGYL
jgi:hypothetical protein